MNWILVDLGYRYGSSQDLASYLYDINNSDPNPQEFKYLQITRVFKISELPLSKLTNFKRTPYQQVNDDQSKIR